MIRGLKLENKSTTTNKTIDMVDSRKLEIFGHVYKIINTINGKIYIGITRATIKIRWNSHKHNSLRKKKKAHLNNAISKYGPENFTIKKLKTCFSADHLYNSEIYFIGLYKSNNRTFGYNNSIGGEKSSLGKKVSEESKLKLSNYQRNRKRTPHSEAAKEKMRLSARKDMSAAIKASSIKRKGVPLSTERRLQISQQGKGKHGKCVIMIDLKNNITRSFRSVTEAAKTIGIRQQSISNVLTNRAKTSGGFIWQYQHKN